MQRPIDAIKWMERLEEEKDSTSNENRKTYLMIQINSISCQREMTVEEIISYLEEKTNKKVILEDRKNG